MNMTTFLTKRASKSFTTINELWNFAKEDFKVKPFKNKHEFTELLGKYLRNVVKVGQMPNGKVFWAEIPFRASQGSVRLNDRNVGMIKVGNPLPQEQKQPDISTTKKEAEHDAYNAVERELPKVSDDQFRDLVLDEMRTRGLVTTILTMSMCALDQTGGDDDAMLNAIADGLKVHAEAREADAKHEGKVLHKNEVLTTLLSRLTNKCS